MDPVGNYAHFGDAAEWTHSLLMLLGRLELFSLYILFLPVFRKK